MSVSLDRYPPGSVIDFCQGFLNPDSTVTLGDMHGNTMNFVYKLIVFRVVRLSRADYLGLVKHYGALNRHSTDRAAMDGLLAIIEQMVVNPYSPSINLIGDLMGDRGASDYPTFKVLKKLRDAGVRYVINTSNHGAAFIHEMDFYLAHDGERTKADLNFGGQMRSSNALFELMDADEGVRAEVADLYRTCYRNHLVLFGVQYNEASASLAITAHAPVTLMSVFAAAECFAIPAAKITAVQSSTEVADFIGLVEVINVAFRQQLASGKLTQEGAPLSDTEIAKLLCCSFVPSFPSTKDRVLMQAIWNRRIGGDDLRSHTELLQTIKDRMNLEEIQLIHGHTGPYGGPDGYLNMDSDLGKRRGPYNITEGEMVCSIAGALRVSIPEQVQRSAAVKIQGLMRGVVQRRAEARRTAAVVMIQGLIRGVVQRHAEARQIVAVVKIQSVIRGAAQRRAEAHRLAAAEQARAGAATRIQSVIRGGLQRRIEARLAAAGEEELSP